jgi:hypothetical protein
MILPKFIITFLFTMHGFRIFHSERVSDKLIVGLLADTMLIGLLN